MAATYSTTNPVCCAVEGFASNNPMPKLFIWSSTYNSSEFEYYPATTGTSLTSATSAIGVGFFAGVGAGGRGLAVAGMQVGDVLMHVSQASLSASTDPYLGFGVTLHAVVGSTANGSSVSSSFAYDVTVAQASI